MPVHPQPGTPATCLLPDKTCQVFRLRMFYFCDFGIIEFRLRLLLFQDCSAMLHGMHKIETQGPVCKTVFRNNLSRAVLMYRFYGIKSVI